MANPQKKTSVQPAPGQGVRHLGIKEMLPSCEVFVNTEVYRITDICKGKKVVDIGCGYGRNRSIVEGVGGTWTGVEPFEGGAHTVVGDAQNLPFENNTFDVAIMDSVLEHIPDASKAFREVARVLKPGGVFIGYAAFMECFHEISYSHLSFRAIEHYSEINGMKLEKISGGRRFGIDYHLRELFYPLPFHALRGGIAFCIRSVFKIKSWLAYLGYRMVKKQDHSSAKEKSSLYFKLECLRQSNGFSFLIRKNQS